MITVKVQGASHGQVIEKHFSDLGIAAWTTSKPGNSEWVTVHARITTSAEGIRSTLRGLLPPGRRFSVTGDGAPNRPEPVTALEKKFREMERVRLETNRAERSAYLEAIHATGWRQFSVLGKAAWPTVDKDLQRLLGDGRWSARNGGAYRVYSVQLELDEKELQTLINETWPDFVAKAMWPIGKAMHPL